MNLKFLLFNSYFDIYVRTDVDSSSWKEKKKRGVFPFKEETPIYVPQTDDIANKRNVPLAVDM